VLKELNNEFGGEGTETSQIICSNEGEQRANPPPPTHTHTQITERLKTESSRVVESSQSSQGYYEVSKYICILCSHLSIKLTHTYSTNCTSSPEQFAQPISSASPT
jgi:hypothetical protein